MNKLNLIVFCVIIAIIGRIIPHPPNVTPILSLILLLSMHLSRKQLCFVSIFILLISDLIISLYSNFNIFGSWSFATYSGWLIIALIASFAKISLNKIPFKYLIPMSMIYWIWTNFIVWLISGMYEFNLSGLIICYTLALPFLSNSLLGDLIWIFIIFGLRRHFTKNLKNAI